MAITVEDGTGLANADSYISEADADTYVANFLNGEANWDAASSAAKEQALREATHWLDATYQARWKGVRINETMSLDWPRDSVRDFDDILVADDAVPRAIEEATVEMAVRVLGLATDGDLIPDLTTPGDIEEESVQVGPIREHIKYMGGKGTATAYKKVDRLLAALILDNTVAQRG